MNSEVWHLGKFELRELLGRGGTAEVWKAFDHQSHRHVALKLLVANWSTDPDFVARFTREAQVVAALRHPNIVQIYDFHVASGDGDEDGESAPDAGTTADMVMQYIEGQTLAQYNNATSHIRELLSAAAVICLFTPISLALDYAHRQGVIHRDIKPRNVLFDQTEMSRNPMGKPILTDFGFAKLLSAMAQTIGGTVLGMPLYLSPEQVQDKPVSSRSDLYSLGVMLSEVLVGVPPFQGASLSGTMMQHDLERPPASAALNPALPPNVAQVVLRSLAKDPLDRFPNASAMTVALAEAFELPVPEDLRPAPPAQLGGSCSAYHRADDCDWRVPKTQGRPSLNLWFGWADDGLPVHQGVDKPTPGQDARGNRGLGKSR